MYNAFVLHARGYQDTSLLIDCFTEQNGIINLVAKGAKRPKSRWRGFLQPFIYLNINYVGRSELKTLTEVDPVQCTPVLSGRASFYGFYLNELLLRILKAQESQAAIFEMYDNTLEQLSLTEDDWQREALLRVFEYELLQSLGYGLDVAFDRYNHPIHEDIIYQYDEQLGLIEVEVLPQSQESVIISGGSLLALQKGEFLNELQLKEVKRFMRARLRPHLGDKPFKSRALFKKIEKVTR